MLAFNGLACQKISTSRSVSLSGVEFFELQIRISPRKRIFKLNRFGLFIWAQMVSINEIKNAKKTRDTATLKGQCGNTLGYRLGCYLSPESGNEETMFKVTVW